MRKLLTVVIPVYNTECFLRECLDSLLSTELAKATELLVVDDGSADNSGQIADEYEEKYSDIVKAIHKENGGHGSAINTGIASATGQYFKVVDSDDSVETAAYEAYLRRLGELAETDCDLVATPFACVWYKKTGRRNIRHAFAMEQRTDEPKQCRIKQQDRKIEGAEAFRRNEILPFKNIAERLHVRMHEWTIRTALLQEHSIRLSEHCFYVDMQYILFPVPWIKTVCILDERVYCYRIGEEGQSVSIRNMQKNREQHRKVMRSLMCFYKTREAAGDSRKVLAYLARGIAKMEANQVQTLLSLPIGKAAKKELMECEQEVRKECLAAYRANEKRSLWLLRKSRYGLYLVAALMWRMSRKTGK